MSVDSHTNDTVGRSLVYEVKEEFRSSSGFNLVDSDENMLKLIIYTMPKSESNPGLATIYSVTWVFIPKEAIFPLYLDGSMGYAGRSVVESSARGIVAATDELISTIAEMARDMQSGRRGGQD